MSGTPESVSLIHMIIADGVICMEIKPRLRPEIAVLRVTTFRTPSHGSPSPNDAKGPVSSPGARDRGTIGQESGLGDTSRQPGRRTSGSRSESVLLHRSATRAIRPRSTPTLDSLDTTSPDSRPCEPRGPPSASRRDRRQCGHPCRSTSRPASDHETRGGDDGVSSILGTGSGSRSRWTTTGEPLRSQGGFLLFLSARRLRLRPSSCLPIRLPPLAGGGEGGLPFPPHLGDGFGREGHHLPSSDSSWESVVFRPAIDTSFPSRSSHARVRSPGNRDRILPRAA